MNYKHGMTKTREHKSWRSMIDRCYNQNAHYYNRYGGRGIIVCKSWKKSFINFYNDMGKRPLKTSLDRINNDGNYEPSNCRWANQTQQNQNKCKKNYVGVRFNKLNRYRKYSSSTIKNGKMIYLGSFATKEEAKRAYLKSCTCCDCTNDEA